MFWSWMMALRITLLTLLLPAIALAHTVYESKGEGGRVYSDRPLPGGKAVELPPLIVVKPPPKAAAPLPEGGAEAVTPAAAPRYRSLAVVFPEAGGTVAANYATFEVRLAADPALQVERGHAFTLTLDGRPVPGRFTGNDIQVPPAFFGDVVPAGVQRHVLEAAIVDSGGVVLQRAEAIDFQTRFFNVLQRPAVQPPQFVIPASPAEGRRRPPISTQPASPMANEPVRPVRR